jgi:hypothetical protein
MHLTVGVASPKETTGGLHLPKQRLLRDFARTYTSSKGLSVFVFVDQYTTLPSEKSNKNK